jgi:Flp pilus assembly protein TadB
VVAAKDAAQAAQLHDKYLAEATRYRDEQKDLDAEARKLEQETEQAGKRADRYDLGEVFLEIALVVTSITLLSGRRAFWQAGIVLGVVGVVVAATGLLLH